MKINTGIDQVIPIRITFGGAVIVFDFRKLLNDKGEVVVFRVFDNELPDALRKEFSNFIAKVGDFAEKQEKFATVEELRDKLNVYEARELMTETLKTKVQALLVKNKQIIGQGAK